MKGRIRLASSDDNIAPFLIPNYEKLVSRHPKRADIIVPKTSIVFSFFIPNVSGAGPDEIVTQIFKNLISKSNGNARLIFLKSLTKLLNVMSEGKVPE